MMIDALAMMTLARARQPSILSVRGAYAALTSTVGCAAAALAMLMGGSMPIAWKLGLVIVSILFAATFLSRDEGWTMVSIALPRLRAPTQAGKT
jgi:hypothetical protein